MQYTSYIGSISMDGIYFVRKWKPDGSKVQVKLDKYQKCGNIISQTSLLSSYTIYIYIYTQRDIMTEPIDAVNILPLARFEPTTMTTPPSTTPNIDDTNCATETSQKRMFRKRWYWRRLMQCTSYIGSFSMDGIFLVRNWKPDESKDTREIR